MNQNHGKGLFGFLAGITAGGLVALLTAKRSGSDVRKDLKKEWSQGKSGSETLKKELTGLAEGVRDVWEEVTATPQFKNASKELRLRFEDARSRAEEMLAEAEERASEFKGDAMGKADKLRKEAQKKATKLMEDAKAAIMEDENIQGLVKQVKKATGKPAAKKPAKKAPAKKSAAKKPAAKKSSGGKSASK